MKTVEFKAGEYVEGIYAGEGSYGEFWFTGGKTKDEGRFICEDKHGGLLFFTEIRKLDPDKKEIERMIKESKSTPFILSNPEPTFKAGDMVEGRMKNWREDVWTGENLIYTGAKTKSGLFICEHADGEVACFVAIKKTDPDKVYREIADDILSRKSYEFATIKEFSLKRNELLNLLIEALKKGKEL